MLKGKFGLKIGFFKNWICESRWPGRDIVFYPNKIRQKLTENQRVKHVNFACFENTTSRKTSLPQHDPESTSNDETFRELKCSFSLSQKSNNEATASIKKMTRGLTRVHNLFGTWHRSFTFHICLFMIFGLISQWCTPGSFIIAMNRHAIFTWWNNFFGHGPYGNNLI